jgi:hypothetical protein
LIPWPDRTVRATNANPWGIRARVAVIQVHRATGVGCVASLEQSIAESKAIRLLSTHDCRAAQVGALSVSRFRVFYAVGSPGT